MKKIVSKSKRLGKVVVPIYTKDKELVMLPINLEGGNILPKGFKKYKKLVEDMIRKSPVKEGIAYLTIHEKKVKKGKTQRRPGPHIDGNYFPSSPSLDSYNWIGDRRMGWKVGGDGRTLSKREHIDSYDKYTGGMLIVSTHSLCKGWNGTFEGKVAAGGDATPIKSQLKRGFMLKPNVLYLTNSQFVHESTPTDKTVNRTLVRITLPANTKVL